MANHSVVLQHSFLATCQCGSLIKTFEIHLKLLFITNNNSALPDVISSSHIKSLTTEPPVFIKCREKQCKQFLVFFFQNNEIRCITPFTCHYKQKKNTPKLQWFQCPNPDVTCYIVQDDLIPVSPPQSLPHLGQILWSVTSFSILFILFLFLGKGLSYMPFFSRYSLLWWIWAPWSSWKEHKAFRGLSRTWTNRGWREDW